MCSGLVGLLLNEREHWLGIRGKRSALELSWCGELFPSFLVLAHEPSCACSASVVLTIMVFAGCWL